VADKLPYSILLDTDVPVLVDLLKEEENTLMAVTWSQACKLKWSQLGQSRGEILERLWSH